ncbi:hypothetical protein [Floridanema aerugineum]|uniref:Uncharacterized protein n=1 Tax=Floridaenema aerugineum BLCC-F46 TaxID=3153654 RepID=A0ABV4X603_9CYAN
MPNNNIYTDPRLLQEVGDLAGIDARELAAAETGLAIDVFPVESPFVVLEILNNDYLIADDND